MPLDAANAASDPRELQRNPNRVTSYPSIQVAENVPELHPQFDIPQVRVQPASIERQSPYDQLRRQPVQRHHGYLKGGQMALAVRTSSSKSMSVDTPSGQGLGPGDRSQGSAPMSISENPRGMSMGSASMEISNDSSEALSMHDPFDATGPQQQATDSSRTVRQHGVPSDHLWPEAAASTQRDERAPWVPLHHDNRDQYPSVVPRVIPAHLNAYFDGMENTGVGNPYDADSPPSQLTVGYDGRMLHGLSQLPQRANLPAERGERIPYMDMSTLPATQSHFSDYRPFPKEVEHNPQLENDTFRKHIDYLHSVGTLSEDERASRLEAVQKWFDYTVNDLPLRKSEKMQCDGIVDNLRVEIRSARGQMTVAGTEESFAIG